MANQNIRTPRFYPDMVNYLLNRGVASSEFSVLATSSGNHTIGTFTSGSAPELFDMKPLNKCSWDTSSTSVLQNDHVVINIDLQSENFKSNYVAILNHNLKSASGKIRIFAGDIASDVTAVDGANAETADINWQTLYDAGSVLEVVNADSIIEMSGHGSIPDGTSIVIEPATDGSTIIKFPEQGLRYWAIQFEGADGGSGAATDETFSASVDLFVGCVMIGEYYDMPHAPDLSVKRSISFDNTTLQESVGGQRYSNLSSFGGQSNGTTKSPFSLASQHFVMHGGRRTLDLSFSYLASTDVLPDEYSSEQYGDDSVLGDLWNKTHGRHTPFIFSVDKDSAGGGSESEHIFARFAQDSLDMSQVALDTFNVSMKIEEEF